MSDNPLAKPRILATVQQFEARQASSAPLVAMQWERGGGLGTGLKVRFQEPNKRPALSTVACASGAAVHKGSARTSAMSAPTPKEVAVQAAKVAVAAAHLASSQDSQQGATPTVWQAVPANQMPQEGAPPRPVSPERSISQAVSVGRGQSHARQLALAAEGAVKENGERFATKRYVPAVEKGTRRTEEPEAQLPLSYTHVEVGDLMPRGVDLRHPPSNVFPRPPVREDGSSDRTPLQITNTIRENLS